MKHQTGYIWKVGRSWYGRWYQDEIEQGTIVRRQHSEKLCERSDKYRSNRDVQPLLDAKLQPLNDGRSAPEGTLTVAEYGEKYFLPFAARELKPSTVHGYSGLWRMYLKPHLGKVTMRDFRCKDATDVLAAIHRNHGLSRKSLRHCKGLMSTIFAHAKRSGVIDGLNPATDAGVPRAAEGSKGTHAYSADEVLAMLNALDGVSRAAIGLMYFCGLRPGEARATRWDDYDEDKAILRVRASMWRREITAPKTEQSVGVVPVAHVLAEILAGLPRTSEFVLAGPSGRPVDLHNLAARVVVPGLKRCAICKKREADHEDKHEFELDNRLPAWRGWYALRRGLATIATSVDSQLAAKSLLRHSNIQTTAAHYIKSVPAEAVRAVDKINALFDNGSVSGRPS